jgi:transposase
LICYLIVELRRSRRGLTQHPGVEIISRDRASAYAEGARDGAPQAVQVADRFHLLKNLSETVERLVNRRHRLVRQAAQEVTRQPAAAPAAVLSQDQIAAAPLARPQLESAQRREKRLACYTEAMEMRRRRVPVRVVARTVGVCTRTILRWAHAEGFPERSPARRHSILDEFMPWLKKRWDAGCHNAQQLWRELRRQGFSGSREIVRYHVSRWRAELPPHLRDTRGVETNSQPRTMTPPSSRQAMWMLLKKDEQLEDEAQEFVAKLCSVPGVGARTRGSCLTIYAAKH